MLEITEVFRSFQSEGVYSGTPALFIRCSGCNLNCSFCDETYNNTYTTSLSSLLEEVDAAYGKGIKLVVITGGEPTLQYVEVQNLIDAINDKYNDIIIQVESNGYNGKLFNNCITCISPKKEKIMTAINYMNKEEVFFKFVVEDYDDIKEVSRLIKGFNNKYFIQPEYSKQDTVVKLIMDNYDLLPGMRFSFQTHKWVGVL